MNRSQVYLIGSAKSTLVKIGRSVDIPKRLTQLQPGHPAKLAVLWTTEGGSLLEGELHKMFGSYWVFGEWFDFGSLDPVAAVTEGAEIIKSWWDGVSERNAARNEEAGDSGLLCEAALIDLRGIKDWRTRVHRPRREVVEATEHAILTALKLKIRPSVIAAESGFSFSHVCAVRRKAGLPANPSYAHLRPPTRQEGSAGD